MFTGMKVQPYVLISVSLSNYFFLSINFVLSYFHLPSDSSSPATEHFLFVESVGNNRESDKTVFLPALPSRMCNKVAKSHQYLFT